MSLKQNTTPQEVVDYLNEVFKTDPEAMSKLFNTRVKCNDALLKHPTVQCGNGMVGLIGVLNGMFGVDDRNYGCIALEVDDKDSNKINGFTLMKTGSKLRPWSN